MRPSGGASVLVKSSFPQRKYSVSMIRKYHNHKLQTTPLHRKEEPLNHHETRDLQTELQATAVSVTLDKVITICSVYIPPSFSLDSQHLYSFLQQLPSLYIIYGDFNGHNILWGNTNYDSRGELIEKFLTKKDICIMNNKSYTYLSLSANSFSSNDLSF